MDFKTTIDGVEYSTGCLPRVSAVGERFKVWDGGDTCPLIPLDQMKTQDSLEWAEYEDLDQNGDPSCCLYATGNALEYFLSKNGHAKSKVDARKAWVECTGGRGGYPIDGALTYLQTKGFPTKDGSDRIFIDEVFDCPTAEAALSAVYMGHLLVYGHFVPGGHAECGLRIVVTNGIPDLDTRNSWGKSFGQRGYHIVPLANLRQGIPSFGAFAIRSLKLRPIDTQGLVDVKA